MEYFNPKKLLILQGMYFQSVTPIKTRPKKLLYSFLYPYPVTIKYTELGIKLKQNDFIHKTPQNYNLGHSKKTPTSSTVVFILWN